MSPISGVGDDALLDRAETSNARTNWLPLVPVPVPFPSAYAICAPSATAILIEKLDPMFPEKPTLARRAEDRRLLAQVEHAHLARGVGARGEVLAREVGARRGLVREDGDGDAVREPEPAEQVRVEHAGLRVAGVADERGEVRHRDRELRHAGRKRDDRSRRSGRRAGSTAPTWMNEGASARIIPPP